MINLLRKDLRSVATKERATTNAWFFKTGKGQYGFGDEFLGITVPEIRRIIKKHTNISFVDVKKLLDSRFHEERLAGLLILVSQYQKGDTILREKIFLFYLKNISRVNNWDIVDLSAPHILGAHLFGCRKKMRALLTKLSLSSNLWERRVAILATFYFIKQGDFAPSLDIAKRLLNDEHDLIHKAIGWMLREVGKRDLAVLETFLREKGRYKTMPRTMLRYAIERFLEPKRKKYLSATI
ncbi:MAG: DNA alkylation repair protein [Candidatus Yonathbacteria bacterium]|nr:DNA alkylation repair protein [Candidatus Yonathbacteria bacterium]